jgi:hypothetical protein
LGAAGLRAGLLAAGATLLLSGGARAGTTVFTDGAFSPAGYTNAFTILSDPSNSVVISQCASCGDPGQALEIVIGLPTGGGTFNTPNDIGLINTTFAYDPATQGAITAISTSVDKDFSVNVGQNYNNFYHPMIEQGGAYYTLSSAIAGPPLFGPGTTGFNTLSGSGYTAADFVQINTATGALGSAHPDFAGGPILFGFEQALGADAIPGTVADLVYDNLSFTVSSVPEAATWAMMLVGFGGLGAAIRSRRRPAAATA